MDFQKIFSISRFAAAQIYAAILVVLAYINTDVAEFAKDVKIEEAMVVALQFIVSTVIYSLSLYLERFPWFKNLLIFKSPFLKETEGN